MSGQRRFLKMWARTVGMPIGMTDEDKPEFLPISQTDVRRALAFRTFFDCPAHSDLCDDYRWQWPGAGLLVGWLLAGWAYAAKPLFPVTCEAAIP